MSAPARSTIRPHWTDVLSSATSVAVLGIVTTLAALPVVTAGAAVAAASAALHDFCSDGRMPPLRTSAQRFVRALAPSLAAAGLMAAGLLLVVLDVRALVAGRVPGGPVLLAATAAVGVTLLGMAGLTVVEVGRQGGRGWLPAARFAVRYAVARPGPVVGMGMALVLATLLAAIIPVTTPLLCGFALFALHAVARRTVEIQR